MLLRKNPILAHTNWELRRMGWTGGWSRDWGRLALQVAKKKGEQLTASKIHGEKKHGTKKS